MLSRADKNIIGEWWWTVDRWMLLAVFVLIVAGILFSFAASPPVAGKLGLSDYHFIIRQIVFMVPALAILTGVAMLDARQIRRLSLAIFLGGILLMVLAITTGPVVKGASRWISLAGFSLQPSEFVKPAFIVLSAWLLSERGKRPDMPVNLLSFALYGLFVALLVLQPDFGQTVLVTFAWGSLFFMAGLSWAWTGLLAGMAVVGMGLAYMLVPHVSARIDRFLHPGTGDSFQTDTAMEAFANGGWFGVGPGEGTVKRILPDAHTDFVFAVVGEEFGAIVCLVLLGLFAFIVLRGLRHALAKKNMFARLAISGLVVLFGVQAAINMGVNVSLLPAKGMTLPFISYGGSSLLSSAFSIGVVLALTRRRPGGRGALS